MVIIVDSKKMTKTEIKQRQHEESNYPPFSGNSSDDVGGGVEFCGSIYGGC